jgi:8-oxo-dGTP pyrophosphatase MutT (NUDIX family)
VTKKTLVIRESFFVKRYNPAMQHLAEIHRSAGINIGGRTVHRTAVRAVAVRGEVLLMVYSSTADDYNFPGGGVDLGETHEQALVREVAEEVEYDRPMEQDFDVFKMTSHYYACEVEDGFGLQKLETYEANLGYVPVWIGLEQALKINRSLLNTPSRPKWLSREILVLEFLGRKSF